MSTVPDTGDDWLTPERKARIEAELSDGEKLVWIGRPNPRLYARASGCLVLFGLVFGGFAVFWMIMAGAMGGELFALFGIPFVLVGAGLMSAPIWMRTMARNTTYGLTDRRAIIWQGGLFGNVTVYSYTGAVLGRMFRVDRRDSAGDLVFEQYTTTSTDSEGFRSTTTHQRGFMAIDQVHEVEKLVRQTLLSE